MAHPQVPKFGNWESEDDVPYTVYFENARKGRNTGKITNPNDPQENPELFAKMAPQTQNKPPPVKRVTTPEEPIVKGTNHERRDGEFRHSESPAKNENVGAHGGGRGPISITPVRPSVGSEHNFGRSPHHPHYQAKVAAAKGSSSSTASDGKSSYDSSHGTPDRSKMRPSNRGREAPGIETTVPKFGEWDESDPSSADGYTDIFKKVREERHDDSAKSPNRFHKPSYTPRKKHDGDDKKTCCFPWGRK